jgi:hypothetical protein
MIGLSGRINEWRLMEVYAESLHNPHLAPQFLPSSIVGIRGVVEDVVTCCLPELTEQEILERRWSNDDTRILGKFNGSVIRGNAWAFLDYGPTYHFVSQCDFFEGWIAYYEAGGTVTSTNYNGTFILVGENNEEVFKRHLMHYKIDERM